jgi:hypothetical protein
MNRRQQQFSVLRREIEAGLVQLEADGSGIDVAGSELVKTGVALTIASRGPAFAMEGMTALFEQIAREFPKDAARVVAGTVDGHG